MTIRHKSEITAEMKNKLAIFDCDGVLVDSESLSLRALVSCLAECSIQKRPDEFHPARYKGAKLMAILEAVEQESGVKLPMNFESLYRKKMDILFSSELKAIDGVAEAIREIPYKMCVASSGPLNKIKRSLELAGLTNFFGDNIFSSYTIQSWKPEPGIFLHAAKEMSVATADCVVIEDAILGIQAAVRAGMRAAAYLPDGQSERAAVDLGAVPFTHMRDLPRLLNGVFN